MVNNRAFNQGHANGPHMAVRHLIANGWPYIEDESNRRDPPHIIIGVDGIGELSWCDAKATFSQKSTEPRYAEAIATIFSSATETPAFSRPNASVFALNVIPLYPESKSALEGVSPDSTTVETPCTQKAVQIGFAAFFDASALGIDVDCLVVLAGVTDCVLPTGVVLEIRQSRWDWQALKRNHVTVEEKTQANIYSVMLGLKAWRCIFHCSDGRYVMEGRPNVDSAFCTGMGRGTRRGSV